MLILTLAVFINGCASLNKRLVSPDALARGKAEWELRKLPPSQKDNHLVTLVQRLYVEKPKESLEDTVVRFCKDDLISSDVNIFNTLESFGPQAIIVVPYLRRLFSACPKTPGLRERINKTLVAVAGTDEAGLRSEDAKKTALEVSEDAKWTALGLISSIKSVVNAPRFSTWHPAVIAVYNQISLVVEDMSPKDKATLPLGPILEPLWSASLSEKKFFVFQQGEVDGLRDIDKTVISLLVKIGPTSIPTLHKWLSDINNPAFENQPVSSITLTNALKEIGTPEALTAITAWQDERARKKQQMGVDLQRREIEAAYAARINDEAQKLSVASKKAAKEQERKEILALEPKKNFKQVLGIFYDSSLSIQGISAPHYKRYPYKTGVKYMIYDIPGSFLNMSVYILPANREGVFFVRVLPEQIIRILRSRNISEDQMVDATPGMVEYLGATSVIDLATGVMQSWRR